MNEQYDDDEDMTMEDRDLLSTQGQAYSQPAHDDISLQDKNIEPDRSVSGNLASRNFQLGNITNGEYSKKAKRVELLMKLLNIPEQYGGQIAHQCAMEELKIVDVQMLLSNSVDGFVRRQNGTITNKIVKSRESNKVKGILPLGAKFDR